MGLGPAQAGGGVVPCLLAHDEFAFDECGVFVGVGCELEGDEDEVAGFTAHPVGLFDEALHHLGALEQFEFVGDERARAWDRGEPFRGEVSDRGVGHRGEVLRILCLRSRLARLGAMHRQLVGPEDHGLRSRREAGVVDAFAVDDRVDERVGVGQPRPRGQGEVEVA